MTSSPLISVPRKVTSDVDWSGPIRQIIANTYGEQPDGYSAECQALNRCRQDAVRGSAGSDVTGRDLLYKYFGQLELLELRFPDIRVPFPWKDAFTTKEISQLSLAYEKASVIFNIAATLSSLASTQNRSSPEGLKRAFNGFRSAAGMFTYINDNFLHAPSTDLSREVVKTLVVIMSAQATETFLERMNEERKGPGIKARVCAQAASQYQSLVEETKDFVVKGWWPRAWNLLVQCKAAYFSSMAQYNRALADGSSSKHGEAISRLKLAESTAKDAQRLAQGFSNVFVAANVPTLPADAGTSMVELCKNHLALCTEAKLSAISDNDLIYHDALPSEASLSAVDKAVVAEPIPIQEVYGTPEVQKVVGADIFNRLVPLSVHESASLYSEEKAKLVRAQGEACDLADGEMRAALEYMGLPASLAKFRNVGTSDSTMDALADPGPQVRGWAEAVRSSGRQRPVQQVMEDLERLKANARNDLDTAERDLDVEQRECEQARVRVGGSFSQSPSAGLTRLWRQTIKSHRDGLAQAGVSDERVMADWQAAKQDLALLMASDEALDAAFVEAVASAGGPANGEASLLDADLGEDESEAMKRRVAVIEELLGRLNKIKRERLDVFRDLKDRVQSDDISQLLILNRKSQNVEPSLFAAELEKFRAHQTRIGATLHHQQVALQEIGNNFRQLTEGKAAKDIQAKWARAEKKRRDLSARLQTAHDTYFDVRGGLDKGMLFYNELTDLIAGLKGEVSRFVSTRNAERAQEIANAEVDQRLASPTSLDQQFASLGIGAVPSPPPQRQPSYPLPPQRQPSLPSPAPSPYQSTSYAAPPRPVPASAYAPSPASAYAPSPTPSYPSTSAYAPSYPAPQQQPAYASYTRPPPQPSPYAAAPSPAARTSLPPPPAPVSYSAPAYGRPAPPPPSQPSYGYAPAPSPAAAPAPPAPYGYAPPMPQQSYHVAPPQQPYYHPAPSPASAPPQPPYGYQQPPPQGYRGY